MTEDRLKKLKSFPKGHVSIEPCSGLIGLYKTNKYVFEYKFENGFDEFKAVFTDSTGESIIDLSKKDF